jgi:hypothetical protein
MSRRVGEERASVEKVVLKRSGKFKMQAHGHNHCGVDTELDMVYYFTADCTRGSLDARGFLLDQITVRRYFDKVRSSSLSCEKLCIKCCQDLVRLGVKENPGIYFNFVELRLGPSEEASMTYYCDGEELKTLCERTRNPRSRTHKKKLPPTNTQLSLNFTA